MADWTLLPQDPLGFFGLQPGFDRKDLKRAYGKLIKQFKPESHPAEFQRIREAYEMLESENRYGVIEAQMKQAANAWSTVLERASTASKTGSTAERSTGAQFGFDVETAARSPQETYKQLKAQPNKSPQTYFLLATLSDLVESKSSNMYLKWLLTGVKEYPDDPGLLRLVSETISAFTEQGSAAATLQTIAKLVSGDDFYRVTEPLWDRLLKEAGFEVFAKTLSLCERQLKHRTLRPKLAFTLHILRLAMCLAPAAWIEERLKFIESHGSELGSGMDDEIELLRLLHKYRQSDRQKALESPLGAKIDQLITVYCKGSSAASLAEMTVLCDELARNGNGWQQTFPTTASEQAHDTLWLCLQVIADIAQQTGVEFGQLNQQRMQQQADATVNDITKTIQEVSNRISWLRARVYGMPFLVYWLGPLILTFGWSYWGLLLIVWTVMAGLSFAALAVPFWLKKKADLQTQRLIEREYERLWRPRMFRYVQACHAPAQVSISELQKSAHDLGQAQLVDLVLAFAFGDRAMHLYTLLQLFVH